MNFNNKYFILILLIINIFFNYYDFKFDLTSDNKNTLSPSSIEVLNKLNDQLTIKVYLKGNLPSGFELLAYSTKNLLNSFNKENPNIKFEFINPDNKDYNNDNLSLFQQLQDQGLYPTDLKIKNNSETISKIIFPGAIIYYKEKRISLNFLENSIGVSPQININNSIEKLEFNFISMIYKLINTKKPNIAFLKGNGELSHLETKDITNSINEDNNDLSFYFNVDTFNLKQFQIDSSNNINLNLQLDKLKYFDALIVAKPTIAFNNIDKFLIDQYIMNGGKILWLIDMVDASINKIRENNEFFIANKMKLNLEDQFFKYGVRINSNLIEDKRSTEIPIVTGYSNNKPIQEFYKWPYFPLLFSKSDHPISKNLDAIKCDFISSIDTINNNLNKTILLTSSANSRVLPSPVKVSLSIIQNPPPIETYNIKNIPVSVLVEGKFESVFNNRIVPKNQNIKIIKNSSDNKMIFISDGDIIANKFSNNSIYPLGYDNFINFTYEGNKKFIINCMQYLCDNNGLVNLKSKDLKLRLLDKNKMYKNYMLILFLNLISPILIMFFSLQAFKYFNKRYYV